MKNIIGIVAAACVLASCGNGSKVAKDADGAVVIRFGINVANPEKQEPATFGIVQAFNEANKGKYKVEFEASDTESHSKNMKLEAIDGTLPQVFWIEGSEAPEYSQSGLLLDMTGFLNENADVKAALNGMEAAFTDKATGVYGLPYQCNVQGIFYNKAIFDKAGVKYPNDSTTYEDFIAMCQKFLDAGVVPLAIGAKNSAFAMWEFNEFLERYGWSSWYEDALSGKSKFNNSEMMQCFKNIEGMAKAGAFPTNMTTIEYFDAKQVFDDGGAAMFGTGQWDCAEFDKNIGKDIGFWWGPRFGDTSSKQEVAMKVPSAPIGINADVGKNKVLKEAVYAFLKFYYGEEAARISYSNSMFPATNYSGMSASSTQYSINAMIKALSNGWASPASAPDLTVPPAVQKALYDALFGVMQGTYNPAEALDKIDAAVSHQ